MIQRVLIANRGAIATRIQRTLRTSGIENIAVFAEADRASSHVADADYAVNLGDGGASSTYLAGTKLIDAALAHSADAIHPGYGFLSENAQFAEQVEAAGLIFLGPTSQQIQAFGLKHEARRLAVRAKVPLLPGSGLLASLDDALEQARAIGWPVMLKSSAGGGGIGMRACADEQALRTAFEAVRDLASSSFGDARVFVERLVEQARHIEVQVFGDGDGGVVILGDRDCSMQRRNQKIIEEAPAPNLPDELRVQMHGAAHRLMQSINYRSAGTVEFLYDQARSEFYFLEVNARLQVEHGVTEMVTNIDLVQWMIRLGSGEKDFLCTPELVGHAVQVRLYAEDPLRGFRPAPGLVTGMNMPDADVHLRVDSWISAGVQIPSAFDPMLAKIIAHGEDRATARIRLMDALMALRIDGLQTNTAFLREALVLPNFVSATHTTASTAQIKPRARNMEVMAPGTLTSVQDVRGRLGYWHVGLPPSGAFDSRALSRANTHLGNPANSAGLEMLGRGPTLHFACDATIVICGAMTCAHVDGVAIPHDKVVPIRANQTLVVGSIATDGEGMRAYLAVAGGLDIPEQLGSRSTFDLGAIGGHAGRTLRTGDVIPIIKSDAYTSSSTDQPGPAGDLAQRKLLRVVQGPHIAPDFLTADYLDQFYGSEFVVHYNSSRTGVRLEGPTPQWARPDGGNAGLHPSNVHDNAYAFGAIDFTGDTPIILGPDGPSLGGFVCPAAVIKADLWKLGQLRPGDRIRFQPLALGAAQDMLAQGSESSAPKASANRKSWRNSSAEVILEQDTANQFVVRAAGDQFLLLEFGPPALELGSRLRVEALSRWLQEQRYADVLELTPGVRSLQIRIPPNANRNSILALIHRGVDALGDIANLSIPGRIVHLPLAWDDPATQEATRRYEKSVRADAPWCPNNIEFIRRINGLEDEAAVKRIVFDANYLVLGLGDVYLGAPVATPVDPRHRLVTTKYNPARTWTPQNAVGIGGAYLCIYGMEGPGGYQFVGRTIQVWNHYRTHAPFTRPWLLRGFDQLKFFEVSNEELLELRRDFPLGRVELKIEPYVFSMADHSAFLDQQADSIATFQERQQLAFDAERTRWKEQGYDPNSAPSAPSATPLTDDDRGTPVQSPVSGAVWKLNCQVGDAIEAGATIMVIESMKTEIAVQAPSAGRIEQLAVTEGTTVEAGESVALLAE